MVFTLSRISDEAQAVLDRMDGLDQTETNAIIAFVDSQVDSGNWEEIKTEICQSNVIQRDSALFARKLEKALEKYAVEREEEVEVLVVDGVIHNILIIILIQMHQMDKYQQH